MTLSDLERRNAKDPIFPADLRALCSYRLTTGEYDEFRHVNPCGEGERGVFVPRGWAPALTILGTLYAHNL